MIFSKPLSEYVRFQRVWLILIVVLLYFDLRVRKEGYDIEVMAQELTPVS